MQSNDAQLTSREKSKFKIPEYARAFWNQAPMMQNASDTDIMITYDKDNTGRKAYALFDNIASFYKDIHISNRNAYELIQENKRCPLHLDVEWYGLEDVSREQLGCIVHELRGYCFKELNRNIDINVLISSRLVNGNFKNSYHIASPTVVFDNNQDGTMKEFVDEFRKVAQFDFAPNGCVDMSIYTKNRNMRLPHCCKFGSDVPFIRISNDALEDDFTGRYDDPNDEDSYVPFILTNPEINGDVICIHSNQSTHDGKKVKSKKRPNNDNEHEKTPRKKIHISSVDDIQIPISTKELQDVLIQYGDTSSKITKVDFKRDTGPYWQIQCDQKKKQRKCLKTAGKIHDSNNCILFLRPIAGLPQYQLEYHCTASSCSHKTKILGIFSKDTEKFQCSFEGEQLDEELTTYEVVKSHFEKSCLRIRDPFVYIRTEGNFIGQLKHMEFRQFYMALVYTDDDGKTKPFIDAWLMDLNKREASKIVVDPKGTQKDAFNMWRGFLVSSLDPMTFFNGQQDMENFIMGPIVSHFDDVITNGNRDFTNWLLDWMANMVQQPWKKTQVAISLYGKQGSGKGFIFEWFRLSVLGPTHSFQTADPDRDLFTRFSDGFINKVFIQVDETKKLHDHSEKLKNLVTNRTVTWEPKNGKLVTVDNISNLLFTSNNENAISVDCDDRRLVLFRCNSVYKDNKTYFENLSAHLETPGVNVWVYKFLMERDLSKYGDNFQNSRPITDYYKESQVANIPAEKRFLAALGNIGKQSLTFLSSKLYEHFKLWAEFEGHKYIKTHVSFGRDISRVKGVYPRKSHGVMKYELVFEEIKQYLESTNEYDENSFVCDPYNF